MTDVDRRRTLGLVGTGLAFLAGCTETSDDDDAPDEDSNDSTVDIGELPRYASLLPETDRAAYSYGAIDGETLVTLIDNQRAGDGDSPVDPLVGNPVVMAVLFRRIGATAAFDVYQEHDETPLEEGELVDANGVYALLGSYDRAAITTALESAGFERGRDEDAYTVYSDDDSGEAVGVTGEVFAFAVPSDYDPDFDPLEAVERTVATAAGERTPKHETDEEFERLLRAGTTGGMSLGRYTERAEFDAESLGETQLSGSLEFAFGGVEGARGVHQHLSIDGDDATATAVVSYDDEDRVDVDLLESSFGTEADSRAVTRDGTLVAIEAAYAGELADE